MPFPPTPGGPFFCEADRIVYQLDFPGERGFRSECPGYQHPHEPVFWRPGECRPGRFCQVGGECVPVYFQHHDGDQSADQQVLCGRSAVLHARAGLQRSEVFLFPVLFLRHAADFGSAGLAGALVGPGPELRSGIRADIPGIVLVCRYRQSFHDRDFCDGRCETLPDSRFPYQCDGIPLGLCRL